MRYISRMDEKRDLFRHTLATLAYRTVRALEIAPESFADFSGAGRPPVQILAHMGDLLHWALSMAQGNPAWRESQPLTWPQEEQRFFAALAAFDAFLASSVPVQAPIERLLQGPVADALTHAGQLAMLRRLAGSPTRGENFYVAAICIGQVGPVQPEPVKPF
jgi:hypothetical protein